MRANPGGTIAPADVVGRDELIARLWEVLERQSVLLTAERRMGKTCVIQKMQAEAPGTVLPVYRDLEKVRTPLEFADDVYRTVREYLSRRRKVAVRTQKLLSSLGGAEAVGLRFPDNLSAHWKKLLASTLEDLAEHQDHLVVFFWDELPLMLRNIARGADEAQATALLDTLRGLRQTHPQLRMVYTGSIGLHHVIRDFRRGGYANSPVNDMLREELPPLTLPGATDLAARLLAGEGLSHDPLDPTPAAIAQAVDRVPYYIHHVVDQMKRRSTPCRPAQATELVASCLIDPHDPWVLRHYRERVDIYYDDPKDREVVLALLDVLAGEPEPLSFDELFNRVKSAVVTEDRERAHDLLELLQQDHYVLMTPEGEYRFRYPMIQRWWHLHRG